jgi:broad specificity phosphatase PhoE
MESQLFVFLYLAANYDFDECDVEERWWEKEETGDNPSFSSTDVVGRVIQESQNDFVVRVAKFREWLQDRPESAIVVVGHSNFFRHFLGASSKMSNCEVKKIVL